MDFSGIQLNPLVSNSNMLGGVTADTIDCTNVKFGARPFPFNQVEEHLTSLILTGSDTSTCTNMASVFHSNSGLTSLDISHWDVSNVTNMLNLFGQTRFDYLNISTWDFASIPYANGSNNSGGTNCNGMWQGAITQQFVAENVKMNAVSSFNLFGGNYAFGAPTWGQTLDLSTWDMTAAVDIGYMFFDVPGLPGLNITGWDTSNVTNMDSAFFGIQTILQTPSGIAGLEAING